MTDTEFTKELSSRGFKVLIPGRHEEVTTYGWIDIGGGHLVNRWNGGSTRFEQLAFCIEARNRLDRSKPAAKLPVKATKAVAKKAAKKVAKKGGK
jgi:hypothetical protein